MLQTQSQSRKTDAKQGKISVMMVDYDGCGRHMFEDVSDNIWLGTYRYQIDEDNPMAQRILKEANKEEVEKVRVTLGSHRQDHDHDQYGNERHKNGYCFQNYPLFNDKSSDKSSIKFVPILTTDISNEKEIGTAIHDNSLKMQWDEYKLGMALMNAHFFAQQYPNESIVLNFFDDRWGGTRKIDKFFESYRKQGLWNEYKAYSEQKKFTLIQNAPNKNPLNYDNDKDDILGKWATLFGEYDALLPKNVQLNINWYAGEDSSDEIVPIASIQGKGPILEKTAWKAMVNDILKTNIHDEVPNQSGEPVKSFKVKKEALRLRVISWNKSYCYVIY